MKTVVEILVLPPFNLMLLIALGLVLVHFRVRAGWVVATIALVLLYALSTPLSSGLLSRSLHTYHALDNTAAQRSDAQAIVVLGAGKYTGAPEYGGDTIRGHALERARYGVYLHRLTGKPIMVSGGDPRRRGGAEADLMRRVIEDEFGAPVAWVETTSDNTFESARDTWNILSREGIDHVFLVTHSDHMERAIGAYERFGFRVTPAPTIISGSMGISWLSFVPRAGAMAGTARAIHEWIGRAWYTVRG